MRFLTTASACVLALSLLMTGESMAESSKTEVIAHRGASYYAPENTLSAFRLADEMDAEFFELDCTLSSDGEVIVIHDNTLDRTTPLKGKVIETPALTILNTEAGAWFDKKFRGEPVPTLDQTLNYAKDTIGVYIEIKDSDEKDGALLATLLKYGHEKKGLLPDHKDFVLKTIEANGTANLELTRKVIEAVRERDMEDEVVIQSFSPVVCAVAMIEAPEIRTELLAGASSDNPQIWKDYLAWGDYLNTPGFNCSKHSVTAELVAKLHKQGRTNAVWTVNDRKTMEKLIRFGTDRIITDRPDLCREVIEGK